MTAFTPGDLVRIRPGCAWPERAGLQAIVVQPPTDGSYPQPAKGEVLLRIDNDPLENQFGRWWTCVMPAKDVAFLAPSGAAPANFHALTDPTGNSEIPTDQPRPLGAEVVTPAATQRDQTRGDERL